ncbi:hypothetical protein EGJ89_20830 [Stenotrophomonas maltophilia]|nr:hypothetical protein EGJ89_20830 [Stenotrophomonas maltophilia]
MMGIGNCERQSASLKLKISAFRQFASRQVGMFKQSNDARLGFRHQQIAAVYRSEAGKRTNLRCVELSVTPVLEEERLRHGPNVISAHAKRRVRIKVSIDEADRHGVAEVFDLRCYALECRWITTQRFLSVSGKLQLPQLKTDAVLIVSYRTATMRRDTHCLRKLSISWHVKAILKGIFLNELCLGEHPEQRIIPEGLLLDYMVILQDRTISRHINTSSMKSHICFRYRMRP